MSKLTKDIFTKAQTFAKSVVDGLATSVSPFHSVLTVKTILNDQGFTELKETDKWEVIPGGKYYMTRNSTTIAAFVIGNGCTDSPPENFKVIGCHTDSPCLRLAPISKCEAAGFEQVAIQTYGGGLWQTWFDRTLSLAGRVVIKNANGSLEDRVWRHSDPLIQIPNLAIHLSDERSKFTWDAEAHLRPVIATCVVNQLMDAGEEVKQDELTTNPAIEKRHLGSLLGLMASELSVEVDQIVDFELSLYDTSAPNIVGLHKEFISSPRLDNMCSSICATHALADRSATVTDERTIEMIILYDHEEIGSVSAQGAASTLTNDVLKRVYRKLSKGIAIEDQEEDYMRAVQRSLFVSADMAHAQHPNYSSKHQSQHTPRIHEGIVLKTNCNQRYATDAPGSAIIREIGDRAGVPIQDFIVKQGTACGSTIGPTISSITGMKTIDIGAPQLGMHSIREMCGTTDTYFYKQLFQQYFTSFTEVSGTVLES